MTKKSVDVHPGAITSPDEGKGGGKPSTSQLKDDEVRSRDTIAPGKGRSKDEGGGAD